MDVGAVLHRQCEDLSRLLARDITFTCGAGAVPLPPLISVELLWVARQLIDGAWRGFGVGQAGRIGVDLRVDGDTLELTVEHSRPHPAFRFGSSTNNAALIRAAVKGFGGQLEDRDVIGGVRTLVLLPLPAE